MFARLCVCRYVCVGVCRFVCVCERDREGETEREKESDTVAVILKSNKAVSHERDHECGRQE